MRGPVLAARRASGFVSFRLLVAIALLATALLAARWLATESAPTDVGLRAKTQRQLHDAVRALSGQVQSTEEQIRGAMARGRPEGPVDPGAPGRRK